MKIMNIVLHAAQCARGKYFNELLSVHFCSCLTAGNVVVSSRKLNPLFHAKLSVSGSRQELERLLFE
jgi:hypothetical protein